MYILFLNLDIIFIGILANVYLLFHFQNYSHIFWSKFVTVMIPWLSH